MKAFVWVIGIIWVPWFAVWVVSGALAEGNHTALVVSYFTFFLGLVLAPLTLLVGLLIAAGSCFDACDRREAEWRRARRLKES